MDMFVEFVLRFVLMEVNQQYKNFFLVGNLIRGIIKFKDKDVLLEEGEFIVIPKGIEHLPIADQEVHVMLIEPKTTLDTGNIVNERTVENLNKI